MLLQERRALFALSQVVAVLGVLAIAFGSFAQRFTHVGVRAADLPVTVEPLISNARGFGALKIILASESLRDELSIDQGKFDKLRALYDVCKKKFESEGVDPITGLARDRDSIVRVIDRFAEPELNQILGASNFDSLSRYVVAQSISVVDDKNVVAAKLLSLAGVPEYLDAQQEVAALRERFQTNLRSLVENDSARRRKALGQIAKISSEESVDKLRDFLGDGYIPNPQRRKYPSTSSFPRLSETFSRDILLSAMRADIVGADEKTTTALSQAFAELSKQRFVRHQEELRKAVAAKRPPDLDVASRIEVEYEAEVLKTFPKILTDAQLDLVARRFAQSLVQHNLLVFLSKKEIMEALREEKNLAEIRAIATECEQSIKAKNDELVVQAFKEFLAILAPAKKAKLARLVEID